MMTHSKKSKGEAKYGAANRNRVESNQSTGTAKFVDNRSQPISQRAIVKSIAYSPRVQQLQAIQDSLTSKPTFAPHDQTENGVIQQQRDRLKGTFNYGEYEEGTALYRYARFQYLYEKSHEVLNQLKEVEVYEKIKQKSEDWYNSLFLISKEAKKWLGNNVFNKHNPSEPPEELFFQLESKVVGYMAELNDSYIKNKKIILKYQEKLNQIYLVEEESDSGEEYENPLSVPKLLFRWVSTTDAKEAKKNGITFSSEGGGIPTSTKPSKGIAIQSGAVNISKCLTIDTSKISNFKFEYVPTRSKLKEVKILCDVPAKAIS